MRKLEACAILVVAFWATACSKEEERSAVAIETPEGTVKYQADAGKKDGTGTMTIESPEGKITYKADESGYKTEVKGKDGTTQTSEVSTKVDLAVFEGLLYSGAALRDEKGGMVRMKTGDTEINSGQFLTSDAPEKLVDHYKKALPAARVTSMGPMSYITGTTSGGATYSITISADEESKKTNLLISVTRKQ